jgi:steroid 5-alpha reductase family enzyme
MSPLFLLLISLVCSSLFMVVVWNVAMRVGNAGIVELAWALGFTPLALLYRIFGDGEPIRQNLITLMVVAWSLRLGHHLWKRIKNCHPVENERYRELRRGVSGHEGFFFFWYFQAQGLLLALLSIPVLLSNFDSRIGLCSSDVLGFALWLVAFSGEALADHQLDLFRKNPANHGKVCSVGLWRYSRHPNYFFEWLVWVSIFLFVLPAPWGWTSLFAPALMLFFLLGVSGVPYTEELALRSRGEAYRTYQRTTSSFIPWFPKKGS